MLASLTLRRQIMAVYEVVLRFEDREEVRLTDQPLEVGSNVKITGNDWRVERYETRRRPALARYICVQATTR
jgi:hypothetical protein